MAADDNPAVRAPENPEVSIWRYMDFTKFISLLENQGLFFARADKLGDPFEGSFSTVNQQGRPDVYKSVQLLDEALETMSRFAKWNRSWTMVNCWHINEYESAAMWLLYAKTNEAIAIKSTYRQLCNCLDDECFVGIVEYRDYDTSWIPEGCSLSPYFHKRLSFAHENELRAVVQKLPSDSKRIDYTQLPPDSGIWKAVDVGNVINEVYVAPTCPSWYRDLVSQMLKRYKLDKPVKQSSLDKAPFF